MLIVDQLTIIKYEQLLFKYNYQYMHYESVDQLTIIKYEQLLFKYNIMNQL